MRRGQLAGTVGSVHHAGGIKAAVEQASKTSGGAKVFATFDPLREQVSRMIQPHRAVVIRR